MIDEDRHSRIQQLEEEEDAREQEERDVRKDTRQFWFGLGLGIVPQLLILLVKYLIGV
jgi:hypothetical protein